MDNFKDRNINSAIDSIVQLQHSLAEPGFMSPANADMQRLRSELIQFRLDTVLAHLRMARDNPSPKRIKTSIGTDEATYDPDSPPHRPGKQEGVLKDHKVTFLLDLENDMLKEFDLAPPKGCYRHLDVDWAAHMKKSLYPFHNDADWGEYVQYCKEGHGDEWFFDMEQ